MSRKKIKQQNKGTIIWIEKKIIIIWGMLVLIALHSNVEFSWLKTLLIESAVLAKLILELARFLEYNTSAKYGKYH